MEQFETQLSDWMASLEKRGYRVRQDGEIVGKPGNREPLTDEDFQYAKANKPAIVARSIKQSDLPVSEPLESSLLTSAPGAILGTGGAAFGSGLAEGLGAGIAGKAAGRLGGATLGTYAAEQLPTELGGVKEPSLKRASIYGALQEFLPMVFGAASRKTVRAGEEGIAKETEAAAKELRGAYGAEKEAGESLKKQQATLLDKINKLTGRTVEETQAKVEQVQSAVGRSKAQQALGYKFQPADPSGLSGDPARKTYQAAATAARAATGKPLGEAYEELKLSEAPAPAIDTSVEGDVIGILSPRAKSLLERGKRFGEPLGDAAPGKPLLYGPGDEVIATEGAQPERFMSLDDLRGYRQEVSKAIKGAQGADRTVLRALRDAADDKLAPYLPLDVQALRAAHTGTMRVLPYKTDAAIAAAENPAAVAEHVFGTPERAKALLPFVHSPEDQEAMRHGFTQYMMTKVDANASAEKQIAQMKKVLDPWQKQGIVSTMFGSKKETELKDALNMPRNLYAKQRDFSDPQWRAAFDNEFAEFMKTPEGQEMRGKMEEGFRNFQGAIAATDEGRQRLASAPSFEAREAGIEKHLTEGTTGDFGAYLKHRTMHHLLWAGLGGGLSYELSHPAGQGMMIGVGSMLAWDGIMRAGAAPYLASFLASDTKRAAARNFARVLVGMATQGPRIQEAQQSQSVQLSQ